MAAYASVAVLLLAGWAALNPEPMSWAYIAAVAAFEIWLARRMAALPRSFVHEGEPPYHFSADEAQLVGRYRFYFTYPALARESASVLAAIGPRCACSKRTTLPGPRSAPRTVFRIWVKVRAGGE